MATIDELGTRITMLEERVLKLEQPIEDVIEVKERPESFKVSGGPTKFPRRR